ncbi:hypothetical protein Malapachy_1781 [Malassezia pachydermatis]|uniref:Uncharacterized protein n=1 Tax=Malassezia pachydermatis TaxID=77020 RepID=A0A0N0RS49_9BASI|nr:hypothetical protein Malapachy_1781 [Malassezia pachydermatis]KOS13603.1 hypothetical protein Malapachy_1781 [Malassezia pachydermatis]
MSQRLAALKALYESGQNEPMDASVDQSTTTYPHVDASLGLDSSTSLDLSMQAAPPLLSSTDDSAALGTFQDEEASSYSHDDTRPQPVPSTPEPASSLSPMTTSTTPHTAGRTPTRPTSASSSSKTPMAATQAQPSSYATPTRGSESSWSHEDSSLSTSLRASQLARSHGALELLDEEDEADGDENANQSSSGHWGVQEMRRRTAAGISIKSTLQKIEQLTAERDDLKIEVDFHRRNMSPDDVGAEVISLRQEKLGYVRRLQRMNELVKNQDQALKTVNRQVKAWEAKWADYETLQAQLADAEARAKAAEEAARGQHVDADVQRLEVALQDAQSAQRSMEREMDLAQERHRHAMQQALRERDAMVDGMRADLAATQDALERARAMPMSPSLRLSQGQDVQALQQQIEEQHEAICSLQDALAAERLNMAEKDGEVDRLEAGLEEAEAVTADLQRQIDAHKASDAAAQARVERLQDQVQQLTQELRDAHHHHDGVVASLHEKLASSSSQVAELREAADRYAAQRADLERLNARLNDKLVELVKDLKDEEMAREQAEGDWSQRYDTSEVHTRRALGAKNALIESLEQQLSQLRDDKRRHEHTIERLEQAAQAAESSTRRQVDEAHARHRREMDRLVHDMNEKLGSWQDAQDEVARLRAESDELATALQTETRTRMNTEDRLDAAQRALEEARLDTERLKLQRDMSASPRSGTNGRSASESHARTQLAERNALLMTVYDSVVRALAEDEAEAGPGESRLLQTHFSTFQDKLTQRLRRLASLQSRFTQRTHALEKAQSARLADLRREHEVRWHQVERMERTIRLATEKQAQWRRRVQDKEQELVEWQRRHRELEHQLARAKDTAPMATAPSSPGQLSVRLRELERRCKEADERVKRERAGAKERAARDEARIRHLQTLLDRLSTAPP